MNKRYRIVKFYFFWGPVFLFKKQVCFCKENKKIFFIYLILLRSFILASLNIVYLLDNKIIFYLRPFSLPLIQLQAHSHSAKFHYFFNQRHPTYNPPLIFRILTNLIMRYKNMFFFNMCILTQI